MKNLIIILLTSIFFGCSNNKQAPSGPPPAAQPDEAIVTLTAAQIKNAAIQTGKPEMKVLNKTLMLTGVVDVPPQNLVSVSFPLGGFLKESQLIPGVRVSRGETIAVMEDQAFIQLQQDYLMARNKLQLLEKEYTRQKQLNATKTTSDKVFEQTSSDYQSQKIMVKGLSEKLLLIGIDPAQLNENNISRTVKVRSPISGFVSAVHVNIGKYVNPSDILFDLIDPDHMHLVLTVFEKDLNLIQPGQLVKASLASDPSKTFSAEVSVVSKDLDANRSTQVHCHLKDVPPNLHPGMFVNAQIEVKGQAAVTLPQDAVVRFGDKEYIFLAEANNKFRLTSVRSANAENGLVQVSSDQPDLKNQEIVTKNAYSILMKMKNTGEE